MHWEVRPRLLIRVPEIADLIMKINGDQIPMVGVK
ncbi:hypothetical protein K3495_g5183 [Podosphaera aphanis]|nr:hypothetical protein K3495_g5183 [Podosphaera aphanis]